MHFIIRKPWDIPQRQHTPPEIYRHRRVHRREFLAALGIAGAGLALGGSLSGCSRPTDAQIEQAGSAGPLPDEFASLYPATRNEVFEYGRPESARRDTAEYTNFYEFHTSKQSWRYVADFKPSPWGVEVGGLCDKPRTFDMDDMHREFALEERAYRHRCVETWAMCVPWTGFPLRDLLKAVEPKSTARYVTFETFNRPAEAPNMGDSSFPWPYTEGLTMAEATNELALLATGLYGEPLPKQNGAPVRLVLPWKYGFKSIKSIVKITLTDTEPATFWNTEWAAAYDFTANVDPKIPHPSWSQETEWMLGTRERYQTVKYNGYGDYVGKLYS